MIFCQKIIFWHFFGQNFQKCCLDLKKKQKKKEEEEEKKNTPEKCLNMIFKQFQHF